MAGEEPEVAAEVVAEVANSRPEPPRGAIVASLELG